jgi:NAD+ synthase/NAD+ synthase (glutamine-hydrolysing)
VKIALAQINPTVGDFEGNAARILAVAKQAQKAGAGLVVFSELSICGYPPRDLVEFESFLARNMATAESLAAQLDGGIAVIVGLATHALWETGKRAMNSAALLRNGRVEFVQSKRLLPTYDVFDEARNFAPAPCQELFEIEGRQVALTICEDAWNDKSFWPRRLYSHDPVEELVQKGAEIVLNISASPFHVGKTKLRREMLAAIATRHKVPVIFVNQVGGNDSLIFDGSSVAITPEGDVAARARSFEEDLVFYDTDSERGDLRMIDESEVATAYQALVLGTRDYVRKCGFSKAIVGLSGGIDSALTAAIATEALGKENVVGVGMPSQFSSEGSVKDARDLASNLGIRFELLPIQGVFSGFREALGGVFAGLPEDVTEENIQARIRGTMLMALSNKLHALVLTTGNKSESGVGYCTLYGDMAGGLAVISDVPKTKVYSLAGYVNRAHEIIPESTIAKPPSAELRPDQKDSDSLPEYEVLDAILYDYVEVLKDPGEIARTRGLDKDLVCSVVRMIQRNEYKRQQAAPGLRISQKAFGPGRRLPVAAKHPV